MESINQEPKTENETETTANNKKMKPPPDRKPKLT